MTDVKCDVKHTKYQPTDAEWKCPKCGVGAKGETDGFFNDESENDDCPLLHETDGLKCYRCGHEIIGKSFAARLQKAANMVPCPCCKGKGIVPAEKAAQKEGGVGMTSTKRRHEKALALYEERKDWPSGTTVTVRRDNGKTLRTYTECSPWFDDGGSYVRVFGIPGNTRLDRVTLRAAPKGGG